MTRYQSTAEHSLVTMSGRVVRLPMSESLYQDLLTHLDHRVAELGCDNTLRHAQVWARIHGIRWERLRRALHDGGGFCDCEVTFNVVDANAYPDMSVY